MADNKITQFNENTAPASGDMYPIVDDPSGSPETQKIDHDNLFTNIKIINLRDPTELTISSGSVTVTQSFHMIDTESDAASDDLDTISGGNVGDIVILHPASGSRTIVFKDGTDNLRLEGDFTADAYSDSIMLIKDIVGNWLELSRCNSGA